MKPFKELPDTKEHLARIEKINQANAEKAKNAKPLYDLIKELIMEKTPPFKNDLELAAYAVANPGFRIQIRSELRTWLWVRYDVDGFCRNEKGEPLDMSFQNTCEWQPYTEPKYKCAVCKDTGLCSSNELRTCPHCPKPAPKLVTWWTPEIFWCASDPWPVCRTSSKMYRKKEDFFETNRDVKVLEWRSFEAPETYEECE